MLFPGKLILKYAKKFRTSRKKIRAYLFDKLVESLRGIVPRLEDPVEMNAIIAEHILCKFWRHQGEREKGGQKRAAEDSGETTSSAKRRKATGKL